MPEVSIIIPVHNAENYLCQCLDSIKAQVGVSFEVIMVDDGSTDSSSAICDEYCMADSRFQVVHKPNGGVSSARNKGIELACGEYVMFVDSDDMLEDGALKMLYDKADGADFVSGSFTLYNGEAAPFSIGPSVSRTYSGTDVIEYLDSYFYNSRHGLSSCWGKLYRRGLLTDMGLRFNEGLHYAEDKLFVFGFLLSCSSIVAVKDVVYRYFVREASLGSDVFSDKHLMQLKILLPLYKEILDAFTLKCPDSRRIQEYYHDDLVGGYVCRALNVFARRKTSLLTADFISFLYGFMNEDRLLKLFSLRIGQMPNILLYKFGCPNLTVRFYRLTSVLLTCLR